MPALEILSGAVREWLYEPIIERLIDTRIIAERPIFEDGILVNIQALEGYGPFLSAVAMKALGVAADIYAGKFDGSKYQTTNHANGNGNGFVNKDQAQQISKLIEKKNGGWNAFKVWMDKWCPVESVEEIPSQHFNTIMDALK